MRKIRHLSDFESIKESTESENKYSTVIDSLIDSKTMRKIRHLSDLSKEYKLTELRSENKEFIKCPLAHVFEVKPKELPKYENMVNELNNAISERNKARESSIQSTVKSDK